MAITGVVLLVIGTALPLFFEKRTASELDLLTEVRAALVEMPVTAERKPFFEGKLVRAFGRLQAIDGEEASDPLFDVHSPTLLLRRRVSYFQWVEHRREVGSYSGIGGRSKKKIYEYSYEQAWVDFPIDSGSFQEPEHRNHVSVDIAPGEFHPRIALGGYELPPYLAGQLSADLPLPLKMDGARAAQIQEKLGLDTRRDIQLFWGKNAGQLLFGRDLRRPSIGDVRVQFAQAPKGIDVTLMAKVAGATFEPFVSSGGKTFLRLFEGWVEASDVFQEAIVDISTHIWTSRGLSGALIVLGSILLAPALVRRFSRKDRRTASFPYSAIPLGLLAGVTWSMALLVAVGHSLQPDDRLMLLLGAALSLGLLFFFGKTLLGTEPPGRREVGAPAASDNPLERDPSEFD